MRTFRTRRLLAIAGVIGLAVGLAVVTRTASAEDFVARIDWTMPPRVKTDTQGVVTNITPSRKFISPDAWRVKLDACGSSSPSALANHHWDITMLDGSVTGFDSNGADCAPNFDFPAEGAYPVTLTITDIFDNSTSASSTVVVKDILILSLGDSIAAGQGNPDRHFPDGSVEWSNERCHRTGRNGAAMAARRLEQADDRTSVTFVSVACSGAGIIDGLIGPQSEITSQIEVAAGLLCPDGRTCNSRDDISLVDALLLQIGANDLHFGEIVFDCAFPTFGFNEDCHEDENVALRLFQDKAALPGRFDQLNEVMSAWLRYSGVYLPDYPDPTRGDDGDICEDMKFDAPNSPDGHINKAEATWAYNEVVVPLNNELLQASFRHNWSSLDFIVDKFTTHGYCAGENWVYQYHQSFAFQGDKMGTMHPTEVGQGVYRDRYFDALRPLLD